jgi:hypothetical protein
LHAFQLALKEGNQQLISVAVIGVQKVECVLVSGTVLVGDCFESVVVREGIERLVQQQLRFSDSVCEDSLLHVLCIFLHVEEAIVQFVAVGCDSHRLK